MYNKIKFFPPQRIERSHTFSQQHIGLICYLVANIKYTILVSLTYVIIIFLHVPEAFINENKITNLPLLPFLSNKF